VRAALFGAVTIHSHERRSAAMNILLSVHKRTEVTVEFSDRTEIDVDVFEISGIRIRLLLLVERERLR